MKILLTGAYPYTDKQKREIEELGFHIDFIQYENQSIAKYEDYDAIVCNGLFLNHPIDSFKSLKYIQLTSAGLDRVPLGYIKEHKIILKNARGVYSIPMAEYVVLKILELYKGSRRFYEQQARHEWEKNRNITELYGKRAAIIGCGSVGCETAKRLKSFGVHITGVDIVEKEYEFIDRFESMDKLHNVLSVSDIIILTLPLTEETYHIFDAECFGRMKQSGILVNISRGSVINQEELEKALQEREIAGAALDVFEEEPLSAGSPLWDMDNVIITPHNSFVGNGNIERLFEVIYMNLKEWMVGQSSENDGYLS